MAEGRSVLPADSELMAAVTAGSEDALATLYDRHVDAVFAGAYRLVGDRQVAEEVVQETFLTLWNRAERFDPAIGSLAAWLLAIGRNRAVDRLRAAGRRPALVPLSVSSREDESEASTLDRLVADGAELTASGLSADPQGALEAVEITAAIRLALTAIPEIERQVIVLAYRDELSQSEIAARLGWPLGTVKTRTRRALARLRQALADELGPEGGGGFAPRSIPQPEASTR